MKRYFYDGGFVVIGEADEIRRLDRNLRSRDGSRPSHIDPPVLVSGRIYGLDFEDGTYTVLNANTIIRLMMSGWLPPIT